MLLLAACQTLNPPPKVDVAEPTYARPEPPAAPVVANGAIFQSHSYRPLFEDHRARLVCQRQLIHAIEAESGFTCAAQPTRC